MAGFGRPWMVAGGWAVDLYLGRVTRAHKDVEFAILREDQLALRAHLVGWTCRFGTRVPERPRAAWDDGMWLSAPIHQIWADRPSGDPATLDILLNERSGEEWLFRRDQTVTMPLAELIHRSGRGIPILAPEVVLLYKAGAPQDYDEADYAQLAPVLPRRSHAWLRRALEHCHPGHRWLEAL